MEINMKELEETDEDIFDVWWSISGLLMAAERLQLAMIFLLLIWISLAYK